jgi:hypothetical protein
MRKLQAPYAYGKFSGGMISLVALDPDAAFNFNFGQVPIKIRAIII